MVLPSTGNLISFNQIRIELGVPGATGFNLGGAASGDYAVIQNCQSPFPTATDPDAINEWWGYDNSIRASQFGQGKTGTSCSSICNGTVDCNQVVYNYGSTYYVGDNACRSSFLGNTFFIAPTACSGGTFSGQTCYEFVNGTIASTETCVLCSPNGDPCPPDPTDCCSGGCCNGYCDANPC